MKHEPILQLPVVDASGFLQARLEGCDPTIRAREFGLQVKQACQNVGMFYLVGHHINERLLDSVIGETANFFALNQESKDRVNLKQSPHFRGYGLLKNYRDWREQIHLGPESPLPQDLSGSHTPSYWRLWGENQWPERIAFRQTMLDYFAAVEQLARIILTVLADVLDKPEDFFTSRMKDRPYLLMKAMSYLPQADLDLEDYGQAKEQKIQSGVTAHCDWSWLTFLIQDDVGGLEAQDASGLWRQVIPLAGALVVNTGELLEIETGGLLHASAHRVINWRIDRQRYSIPVFINPALDAMVLPAAPNYPTSTKTLPQAKLEKDHVHKVIKPGASLSAFIFGESEFERKVQGKWCYEADCISRRV